MRHRLRAEIGNGGIKVTDESGAEVKVSYGATADMRTCYAYCHLGFLGGWQCLKKSTKPPAFKAGLVASINQGILYHDMNDLPTDNMRYRPRRS